LRFNYLRMLIATQTLNNRYAEGLDYLSKINYNRYAYDQYAVQHKKNNNDSRLLLLLHALGSWNNSPLADNVLTSKQIVMVVEQIAKYQVDCDVLKQASADELVLPSAGVGSGNAFSLQVIDTSSVDLSYSNGELSAQVKLSPTVGNILQILDGGLFASSSASKTIKLVRGSDFSSATQYDDPSLVGTTFEVWHRGLGYLLYNREDEDDPLNEYDELVGGGFNITIPGFDVNVGNNYFYIII
jgi:hypothetical protein